VLINDVDVIGFCTLDQAKMVGEKVMLVQKDFGDRTNRKHARLKYTLDDRGLEWFVGEVESRLGFKFQPARPFTFTHNGDRFGWTKGINNLWHYTLFVQVCRNIV
jgi:sulfite reductase (NADPH) hemoprotein beta-component